MKCVPLGISKERLYSSGLALLFVAPLIYIVADRHEFRPSVLAVLLVIVVLALWSAGEIYNNRYVRYIPPYLLLLYIFISPALAGHADPTYYIHYYAFSFLVLTPMFFVPVSGPISKIYLLGTVVGVFALYFLMLSNTAFQQLPPTREDLYALYATNILNMFPNGTFEQRIILVGFIALVVAALVLVSLSRPLRPTTKGWHALALAPAILIVWSTSDSSNEYRILQSLRNYQRQVVDYRHAVTERLANLAEIDVEDAARNEPATYVVALDSFITRDHVSLYGYFRNTTPFLNRLRGDLVIFDDAISSGPYPQAALEKALSLTAVDGVKYSDQNNYSILEILRAAGFETYWLSEQPKASFLDDPIDILAEAAQYREFGLSSRILPAVENALQKRSRQKVIFVKLMGDHVPHDAGSKIKTFINPVSKREVGDAFVTAAAAARINAYDNAVLASDHVIASLIEALRSHGGRSALIYFSVNGKAAFQRDGKYSIRGDRTLVEVPLFFWLSPGFHASHFREIERLSTNRHAPVLIDDLGHTILDLVGVISSYRDARRSLFSSEFAVRPRNILDGQVNYDTLADPTVRTRVQLTRLPSNLHEKVWAHRMDSLGKLCEALALFSGGELDVTFNNITRSFEIYHPPDSPIGLSLPDVLDAQREYCPTKPLWLDMKNISESNVEDVVDGLLILNARYGFKERVIIETDYNGLGFNRLSEAGFYTSYYLPTEEILDAMEGGSDASVREIVNQVISATKQHRARAVSFDSRVYPFVLHHLAEALAPVGLEYLTWDLTLNSSAPNFLEQLSTRQYSKDTRVKIVLVEFTSRYDR